MISKPAPYIDAHRATYYNNFICAGVAELAYAADLKSAGAILVGSSPTLGTIRKADNKLQRRPARAGRGHAPHQDKTTDTAPRIEGGYIWSRKKKEKV